MTTIDEVTASAAVPDDHARLLRCLARKDFKAGAAISFSADDAAITSNTGRGIKIASRTVEEAVCAGWITVDNGLIKLAAQGKSQLRRLLSDAQPFTSPKAQKSPRPDATKPGFNPFESPIAWLHRRRGKDGYPLISVAQLAASERLRADFWYAGMSPRVTMNWSETASISTDAPQPSDAVDNSLAASERVRLALSAVGPELSSILVDVCCHLKGLELTERQAGWPQRSARIVLDLALTRLARHYGLDVQSKPSSSPSRIRHWGAMGYRPAIDG